MTKLGKALSEHFLKPSTRNPSTEIDNEEGEKSQGLTLLLSGPVGSGKTTFSRGFVRSFVGSDDSEGEFRVTSPSYLIDNVYFLNEQSTNVSEGNGDDGDDRLRYGKGRLHHIDLYRLLPPKKHNPDTSTQMQMQTQMQTGCIPSLSKILDIQTILDEEICLIEWPERLLDSSSTFTTSSSSSEFDNDDKLWNSDSPAMVKGIVLPRLINDGVFSFGVRVDLSFSVPTATEFGDEGEVEKEEMEEEEDYDDDEYYENSKGPRIVTMNIGSDECDGAAGNDSLFTSLSEIWKTRK